MSEQHGPKGGAARLMQALVLALLVGLLFVASRYFPPVEGRGATIAALGFLLLAGTLTSELLEPIGLPHLTGYILTGAVAGPYVLNLVDHHAVDDMAFINSLALALIALAGGAELRIDVLRSEIRGLGWAMLVQCALVFLAMTVVFFALRPFMPFASSLNGLQFLGVAILWGCIAASRSPSAVLGILAQTRANGPVATRTLAFVMVSDVVVAVMFAFGLIVARPLIDPAASFSLADLSELGHELIGSVAIGTTLGLVLAAYLRLIGTQLILLLLALGFGAWEVIRYLQFDSLLTFLVAGFVVQNLSSQGERFLHAIEQTGGVVFVLFFATAGAHLNIPLLGTLGPLALVLVGARAAVTFGAARVASRLSGDGPLLTRWSWAGLVSQAGLTLGFVVLVEKVFPAFGTAFRALGVAAVAINEMVGPILFKLALDRAGETSSAPAATRKNIESGELPVARRSRTPSPPAVAAAERRSWP